ncbi:MAG: sulfatase-like hydrolase/transferase [Planctomycetota bacterium]
MPRLTSRYLPALTLFAYCLGLAIPSEAHAEPAPQPNILWIITDDQRADSIAAFNRIRTGKPESALGYVSSPNVDRLVAEGVTFINAYNQSPACAPSRSVMHSGRYPHRRGVYGFELHHANNPDLYRPSIPQNLAAAGYQTARSGKLGERTIQWDGKGVNWKNTYYQQDLGSVRDPGLVGHTDWINEPVWQREPRGHNLHLFFDDGEHVVFFNPSKGEMAPEDLAIAKAAFERLDMMPHYKPGEETPYGNMVLAGVSSRSAGFTRDGYHVRQLKQYLSSPNQSYETKWGATLTGADPSKPQFLHLGFDFPHTPVVPPASFREQFMKHDYNIPGPAPGEIESFPPTMKRVFQSKQSDHFTDAEKLQMIRDYYAFCAYGDALVGEAVEAFKAYSEANNQPWMILYVCGDHGWRLNEHGMVSKFLFYHIDLNNPIVVVSSDKDAWPAGKVVHDLVEFVDMAPTFYAAAGIDTSGAEFDHLDGLDLAKVMSGEASRDYVLAEGWWVSGPRASIRTKEYAFSMKVNPTRAAGDDMDWPLDKTLEEVEPMFFDLRIDPGETQNLAFDKRYAGVVTAMRNKLEDAVIRDGRIEVDWRNGLMGKVFRLEGVAPKFGGHDRRLELPYVEPTPIRVGKVH